jgi:hypothetical protein
MEKVLEHFLYVIELHSNNAFIVYSRILAKQITLSHAAAAFQVFRQGMHQIEIVRLCALWDSADPDKENIATVIELIDDDAIIDMLADETRGYWAGQGNSFDPSDDPDTAEALKLINKQFGDQQAAKAKTELRQSITDVRNILGHKLLHSVMNLRDKSLAHSLTQTRREKRGPIESMRYGDETLLIQASIPIIERLFTWVNGKSFSIADSQEIDQNNAEALWSGCTFTPRR